MHGAGRGSWLAVRRLLRCAPWHPGGVRPACPGRAPAEHRVPRRSRPRRPPTGGPAGGVLRCLTGCTPPSPSWWAAWHAAVGDDPRDPAPESGWLASWALSSSSWSSPSGCCCSRCSSSRSSRSARCRSSSRRSQKLRKQYGSDRQGISQAMMALQKERGRQPARRLPADPPADAGLHRASSTCCGRLSPGSAGPLRLVATSSPTRRRAAKLFGAPISASFNMSEPEADRDPRRSAAAYANIRVVALVLIVDHVRDDVHDPAADRSAPARSRARPPRCRS